MLRQAQEPKRQGTAQEFGWKLSSRLSDWLFPWPPETPCTENQAEALHAEVVRYTLPASRRVFKKRCLCTHSRRGAPNGDSRLGQGLAGDEAQGYARLGVVGHERDRNRRGKEK